MVILVLREVPIYERPREKALKEGVKSLSNVELMAIILRTGSKDENVMEVAKKIIYSNNNLASLGDLSVEDLITFKGIGKTKAITIVAMIELGIRIVEAKNEIIIYNSPEQIFNYYQPRLSKLPKENLYALYLNSKGFVIKEQLISQGTVSMSLLDGKDIFKWALKVSASAIILIHNHPSGDPTPSLEDLKSTKIFINQAKIMELVVLDHIIVGNTYYSMKTNSKFFKLFA